MILAIDFDNTIHDIDNPVVGKKMGKPLQGATEALELMNEQGHKIIIHTVRGNQKHIREWFEYYDIPYDEITNIKPKADWYIDDKSLHFDNWANVLNTIGVHDD